MHTTRWSKSDGGEIFYDISYMWILKSNDTNDPYLQNKETHRLRKWTYGCQEKEMIRGIGCTCTHYYI